MLPHKRKGSVHWRVPICFGSRKVQDFKCWQRAMEDYLPLFCFWASCSLLLLMGQIISRRWHAQGEPRHEGFQLSVHLAKAVGCSWDSAGLPDFVQSLALESVEACGTCVICLEQFGRASKLSCGHLYHAACIKEWCRYGDMQCPLCRTRHGAIVSEPLESGGFRIRL